MMSGDTDLAHILDTLARLGTSDREFVLAAMPHKARQQAERVLAQRLASKLSPELEKLVGAARSGTPVLGVTPAATAVIASLQLPQPALAPAVDSATKSSTAFLWLAKVAALFGNWAR